MKRTLSFMVMALALLLTQCRKPEVKFPSPVAPEGTTVSMTVTAGPGSKTDIITAGGIKWSTGDKLYVGDGTKYVGYLTLQGAGGSATGTFSGDVTLTGITEGVAQTFHFYYLGSTAVPADDATSVDVSFATQEIYAEDGKLKNASKHHVGYGSAKGTVKDGVVTGINVTLVSKVALARFSFTKGGTGYSNALTLSGTNIYNKMTVNFGANDFSFSGTEGSISLTGSHAERYVMLVPVGTGSETLSFAGEGLEGSKTLGSGIEANKFYRMPDGSAIEVKLAELLYLPGDFTVRDGVTVKFSRGNLWYGKADGEETAAFHFEANQWETTPTAVNQTGSSSSVTWDASHVSHFLWSPDKDVAVGTSTSVSGTTNDVLFTNSTETTANSDFHVNGETGTNQWRTLSKDEWIYLLNTSGSSSSSSGRTDANRFAKARVNDVNGMLIFPDGYSGTASGDGIATVNTTSAAYPSKNIDDGTWTAMVKAGVVFLPATGYRTGTDVYWLGSYGRSWSSSPRRDDGAYHLYFASGTVGSTNNERRYGFPVRLVRSAS